jgi:hypothetical protein
MGDWSLIRQPIENLSVGFPLICLFEALNLNYELRLVLPLDGPLFAQETAGAIGPILTCIGARFG